MNVLVYVSMRAYMNVRMCVHACVNVLVMCVPACMCVHDIFACVFVRVCIDRGRWGAR